MRHHAVDAIAKAVDGIAEQGDVRTQVGVYSIVRDGDLAKLLQRLGQPRRQTAR